MQGSQRRRNCQCFADKRDRPSLQFWQRRKSAKPASGTPGALFPYRTMLYSMGRQMTGRLWYPQLDVYDAIRRIAGLLALWDAASPPSQERLYIADFYLANPPLLHKTHMSRLVRDRFQALGIIRPDKSFV